MVMVVMTGMRKVPSESRLKIISKLSKVLPRNNFFLANKLQTFLSHLITGAPLFRDRKGTDPVCILNTAQNVLGSGQNHFLSRASVTHIHLPSGQAVFSQNHHFLHALWLWISILLDILLQCLKIKFSFCLECSGAQAAWCTENIHLLCAPQGCLAIIQAAFMSCPKGERAIAAFSPWHMRHHLRKPIHKMYFQNGNIYH